jgi:hypothetical protein
MDEDKIKKLDNNYIRQENNDQGNIHEGKNQGN